MPRMQRKRILSDADGFSKLYAVSDTCRRAKSRSGLSLAEVSVSTLLVGLLLVTSLQTNAFVAQHSQLTRDHVRAAILCEEMLAEIMPLPVECSEGCASGASTSRQEFQYVDGYDGWNASPPEDKSGVAISDLSGWSRSVSVTAIDPETRLEDTNGILRRITVTVTCPDGETTEAIGFAVVPPRDEDPEPIAYDVVNSLELRIEVGSASGLTSVAPSHNATLSVTADASSD